EIKFVLFYLLLQLILITCSYFYYNNFIKNVYLKNGKLTFLAGFSQFGIFAIHGFLLYLPNFLFTNWPAIEVGTISFLTGFIVCSVSLLILILGFVNLGSFLRTMGINSNKLKVSGIYKYSRNPQILGYGLLLAGFGVLWPSWYIFAGLISYAFIIHKMVLTEEIHLENLYADKYVSYCNKTPRYFRYPPE
ncbi:MAG: hypothetical protein KAS97_11690, partial [Candidatus Aminicenantes bacterium]|nr:hypothetical protein [Candidatus Aminicenantes bacterium]